MWGGDLVFATTIDPRTPLEFPRAFDFFEKGEFAERAPLQFKLFEAMGHLAILAIRIDGEERDLPDSGVIQFSRTACIRCHVTSRSTTIIRSSSRLPAIELNLALNAWRSELSAGV